MNSLVDSVLSLTIGDQIKNERKPLSATKLDALRKSTVSSRKVNFIKPSRPDRKGLNSEIIIEKKLAYAKAQKDRENFKKAELEAERMKQEEIAKQKEMGKPKLPTPPMQQANVSLLVKPKEVEKQLPPVVKPTMTVPSSVDSSLFGNLIKPDFGSPQIVSASKSIETKSIFDGEKSQSPFGITVEKPTAKPMEPTPNLSSNLGRALTFDTVSSTASGFSFGAKTVRESTLSSTASTGFSFGATTKAPTFGLGTQTNSNTLNLAKSATPIQQKTVAPEPKSALLPTPNASTKEVVQTTPIATPVSFNTTPKPTAVKSSPLLATPNIPPQQPSVANPPNDTSFKFDLGNAFSSPTADKSKIDKENTPLASAASITKTNSIGNFSFLSAGNTSTLTPSPKSNLSSPVNSSTIPASTQVSTPSSIGFSFANASVGTPFDGASTAAITTTASTPGTTVTSSTDQSGSIFQGFDVCKPNVADNANSGKSLFSTNSFGTLSGNAVSSTNTASIFGASTPTASTSAQTSLFGGKSITTSANTPQTTSTTTSLFGVKSAETLAAQTTPGTNIFGAKALESASLSFGGFGISSNTSSSASSPPISAGNIFGGAVSNSNVNSNTSTASIFGGATPTSTANAFGSSPFGNNNSNVFGGAGNAATSTASSPTPGTIFGGATPNPSSGGSIFGGSASFSSPQQTSTGFGSSTFGGGFGNATTAVSAFGGSFSQATSNAPAFGAQPAFGSPFGQTTQQQQQSPFGSPQSQQSGFGLSAIAAQSNPTFGSSATFGAAPTFGSPKSGFGTFANVNPNPSFSTPQKNSLFESLGSSENTMTFGNLAHQSPNAAATPKAFSGGSSFSSWR